MWSKEKSADSWESFLNKYNERVVISKVVGRPGYYKVTEFKKGKQINYPTFKSKKLAKQYLLRL